MSTVSFYTGVYELVRCIPVGKVATYGQIAIWLGSPRASRIVGGAMGRAPEDVPSHRVVGKDGRLAPDDAFGGMDRQRLLLLMEGVAFGLDGCVDMEEHGLEENPRISAC